MKLRKNVSLQRKILPVLIILNVFIGCEDAVENSAPVITDLIIYPAQPKAGQTVSLTGIAEDEDGDRLAYKWVASAGTFLDSLHMNPIQWQAPPDTGNVTIYLQVSDLETTTSRSDSVYLEFGAGDVAGHVSDISNGYFLENVVVEIHDNQFTTGTDGFYYFENIIAGSNIPISATAVNYVTYAGLIEVKIEENIVDIPMTLLTEVGRIAGYISDSVTDDKLAGVAVRTGDIIDTTGIDGYYELYNVPISENVPVQATLEGYNIFSSLINVVSGYNTNNIELVPNIAAVSGRVTSEDTGNLLSGVVVTINDFSDTTNVAGYYEIQGIPAMNNASISAELAGYVTSYITVDIVGGTNTLDFSLNNNPGSLSGWVRSATNGSEIESATVMLVGLTQVLSSEDGSYSINGLSTGSRLVRCVADNYETITETIDIQPGENNLSFDMISGVGEVSGFLQDSLTGAFLPGETIELGELATTSGADGYFSFIDVPVGQNQVNVTIPMYAEYGIIVDVAIGQNTHNIMLIPSTVTLLGIVQDAVTTSALSDVQVSLGGVSDTTDANGYYELTTVPITANHVTCSLSNYTSYDNAIELDLGENILNVSLQPATGTIRGYVYNSLTSEPLETVYIHVSDTLRDSTDSEGFYQLEHLPLGQSAALEFKKSNFTDFQDWVSLSAGDNTYNVELDPTFGNVIGIVVDSINGNPLEDVTVEIKIDTVTVVSGQTDSDGYYSLAISEIGSAEIVADVAYYSSYVEMITVIAGETVVNIEMAPNTGRLNGQITDSESGLPIDTAMVIAGLDTTLTDESGMYLFEHVTIHENFTLKVERFGYADYSDNVQVSLGENEINVQLVPNLTSLSGIVSSSQTEAPLESVNLILGGDTVSTDVAGHYTIDSLSVGDEHIIQAQLFGYSDFIQLIVLESDENILDISMDPNRTDVSGHISDSYDGLMLESAIIILDTDTTMSNASGYYEFESVPLGIQYLLRVELPGYSTYNQPVLLDIAENVIDVQMDPNLAPITGYVSDAFTGLPLVSVSVILDTDTVLSDPDGRYEFESIPVGMQYLLRAEHPGYLDFSQGISLSIGENLLDIQMTPNIGSLAGYVLDGISGVSLDSAMVILGTDTLHNTMDGTYTFNNQPAGVSLPLKAIHQGYLVYEDFIVLEAGPNILDIELTRDRGDLFGQVTDFQSGGPVDSAIVMLGDSTTLTDESGYYWFAPFPIDTTVWFSVQKDGYTTESQTVELEPGDNIINVALMPAYAIIRGFIQDSESGGLIDSVRVIVVEDTTYTDADGYYEIEGLPADMELSFLKQHDDYQNQAGFILLSPGTNLENVLMDPEP